MQARERTYTDICTHCKEYEKISYEYLINESSPRTHFIVPSTGCHKILNQIQTQVRIPQKGGGRRQDAPSHSANLKLRY